MTKNLDALKKLNTPAPNGWVPGVEWNGETGHLTTVPKKAGQEPTKDELNTILEAARIDPAEVEVDWSKKTSISAKMNADSELMECWYKLPLKRRNTNHIDADELLTYIENHTPSATSAATGTWRTIMLSDQHVGKGEIDGGGSTIIAERWINSVTEALKDGPYAGINLVMGGDTIEGYISQNGKNINNSDLDLTQQKRIARRLLTRTILDCADNANQVIVSCVPGNHGETTRVTNVAMTDSHDIDIVSAVQEAIELKGLHNITFYYPEEGTGDVTYEAGDTTFTIVHGHKFSSGPVKGAENWWSGQITNDRPAAAADILLYGHFHGYRSWTYTANRWIMSAPSLENQSTWFANATGASSIPGALVFDTSDGVPTNISIM